MVTVPADSTDNTRVSDKGPPNSACTVVLAMLPLPCSPLIPRLHRRIRPCSVSEAAMTRHYKQTSFANIYNFHRTGMEL